MTKAHLYKVVKYLKKSYPEDKRLDASRQDCDDLYIFARYISRNPDIDKFARSLGKENRCAFCKHKCGEQNRALNSLRERSYECCTAFRKWIMEK